MDETKKVEDGEYRISYCSKSLQTFEILYTTIFPNPIKSVSFISLQGIATPQVHVTDHLTRVPVICLQCN